jgi:hypothetical protein
MKWICIVVLLWPTFLRTAPAQAPKHSMSMDVRTVSSGGATRTSNNLQIRNGEKIPGHYQTRDQNYLMKRQKGSGVGLEVNVRNFRQGADEAQVQWYFLGKPVGGGEMFVFDEGVKTVTFNGPGGSSLPIESAELTSTVEKAASLRSGYADPRHNLPEARVSKSGSKVAGWIIRLLAGDEVLQVRASTPSLEALGRNTAQLQALERQLQSNSGS